MRIETYRRGKKRRGEEGEREKEGEKGVEKGRRVKKKGEMMRVGGGGSSL